MTILANRADTISGVARELAVHPANITHHFRILEDASLISLREERSVGHNIEKIYTATAKRFEVRTSVQQSMTGNVTVLGFLRDDIDIALTGRAANDDEAAFGLIKNLRITPAAFKDLSKKMEQLLKEYEKFHDESGQRYSLNMSLYPQERDYGPTTRIDIRKK
jgi:predicted transcriptional regulator